MMRTLAQVLTEEYSEHGVHVANVVIDGAIDSPGTRALPRAQQHGRQDHADLIHQPLLEKRCREIASAHREQPVARHLLQARHLVGDRARGQA